MRKRSHPVAYRSCRPWHTEAGTPEGIGPSRTRVPGRSPRRMQRAPGSRSTFGGRVADGCRPDIERSTSERASKIRRRDADDGEVVLIEGYRLPDHARVGAETALPQSVADHRDRIRVRCPILFRKKSPSEESFHPKDIKV